MKEVAYKTGFKCGNVIVQGVLTVVIAFCLMNIIYWMEGSFSVSEMGKSYEETGVFLQGVTDTVQEKIVYEQNRELFERNGEFDETKEVDIQQYVSGTTGDVDLNTTYYLCDLLDFYENGGQKSLSDRISQLLSSGSSEQEAGEKLDGDAAIFETIVPISGSSLSDYSKISQNSSVVLFEYYQNLCEASQDIHDRYMVYQRTTQDQSGEGNSEAPSNVRYYIENTNTRQRYTNLGVKSFAAAQRMVQNSEELDFIYEGERSFNIMVANMEHVMNDAAAKWFIGTRFLGTGEKVILAVDVSYPIGDELQSGYYAFEKREPVLLGSVIAGIAAMVLLAVLLASSVLTAGFNQRNGELQQNSFDEIPTEIAAGLCLIAGIVELLLAVSLLRTYGQRTWLSQMIIAGAVLLEYWIFLFSLLSLVRRIKGRSVWQNSVCYAVALGCSQVYQAKQSSRRLLISYLIFFALNVFFLQFFGVTGVFITVVMDMAVLLYLMRDVVGNQKIREGLNQLSKGKLEYKIDTAAMTGESLEMAVAVNEMGDGLQQAVDTMVRNERLKGELITNVSHDIKTPLTSIINYVDLLKRENLDNEKAVEYIQVLDHKAQRLKQLTEDLIEASKINSGNVELQLTDLKLGQICQQAYGEFAERLEEKRLDMVLQLPKEPIVINADGRQLWRIFENLLSNIVKYAMPETRAYLEVTADTETARITFKNISRQKLEIGAEELQERFVRGDLSRNTEGSGLGLSIARSLTELMQGQFQIFLDGDFFKVTLEFPRKN